MRLLAQNGVSIEYTEPCAQALIVLLIAIFTAILTLILRKRILRSINKWMLNNQVKWDDLLVQHKIISRLCWFIPLILVAITAAFSLDHEAKIYRIITQGVRVLLILVMVRIFHGLASFANDLYRYIHKTGSPYKGFTDAMVVVCYGVAAIIVTSILSGKSFFGLLSLLGGLTAVTILVFKDTLLNLTASIQLSATDMVRVGDWIEMETYGADGDVIETSLNTIRVQNWDKTITTIPTYALVSTSFKNWRGMVESGGRRIKRSIFIDLHSVKFCDAELLEKLEHIEILQGYLMERSAEMESHNYLKKIDTEASVLNGRRHTNLGLFRAYIKSYLEQHPLVNTDMTFLVRHKAPGPTGLPIEIYIFSKDKVWANYEALQADIFDHLLAAAKEFDLHIFQEPSGADIRAIGNLQGVSH